MQLQAGYSLAVVYDHFKESDPNLLFLLKSLCFFEIENLEKLEINTNLPELATLDQLISRGLPTRPSLFIETSLIEYHSLGKVTTDSLGNILFKATLSSEVLALFERAIHIIDPRINPEAIKSSIQTSSKFDSQAERDFFLRSIPQILGKEWLQLFETQRGFSSIVNNSTKFSEQRADFAIEFPFIINDKKGVVIEIDGPQHQDKAQFILDEDRDEEVGKENWLETIRIPTDQIANSEKILAPIKSLKQHLFFKTIQNNFNDPLYNSVAGLTALEIVLGPLAIARLQKIMLRLLLAGKLSLSDKMWKIAVHERDVSCAILSMHDLHQQIANILGLKGETFETQIELTVIQTQEFQKHNFKKAASSSPFMKVNVISENDIKTLANEYDVFIDISILQRSGFTSLAQPKSKFALATRSSHHVHSKRTFVTADVIKFLPLISVDEVNKESSIFDLDTIQSLQYFLRNIFRKHGFRAGQLEILNKALQGESVIGLLPTGGGKSLTYQLAALLQPGICLIIDPIKSLMKDQCDNLRKSLIDACTVINSSLKTREERTRETNKLKRGEVLFCFVSPERLQMEEFRGRLLEMYDNKVFLNYCVIDEAHCVSEWGHDFRTSYLSLGKNAIQFCKTRNLKSIPLFGLTATASFDVLSDIQRELSGNNEKYRLKEDSVVRFDTVNRKELNYSVLDVHAKLSEHDDEWTLKQKLGQQKQSVLINELKRYSFDDNNEHAGIVFCPHRGWYFGVTDRYKPNVRESKGVYDAIRRAQIPKIAMGSFMGSDSDDETTQMAIEKDSIDAQEKFVSNKLNLLVSTKAFGMGIDKPNVRFTFHVNYPNSIESFVQEAGRAGRDRQDSTCYILFNDEKIRRKDREHEIDHDNLLYFHNSSFKGVDKEKSILFELLTSIHTPNKLFDIEVSCYENFHKEINLALWQSQTGNWYLFVQGESFDDKYGAIKLERFEIDTSRINKPLPECVEILKYIQSFILKNCQGDIIPWLKKSSLTAGIETLLQSNENIELTLRFENNITERIETISGWLKAVIDPNKFDSVTTKDILLSANSFDEFKEKVASKIQSEIKFEQIAVNRDILKKNPSGTSEKELQRLFLGFRVKSDTEKALYRLSTIGVIDDYTIDFNSKTYTLTASRKTDNEYFKNLENYIRKYYSEVRTKREILAAKNFDGATAIQKCLFFLTDFVYREIQQKRFEGIGAMRDACLIGREKGGEAFKEFVELYFNSKYARKEYRVGDENKSLTDRTDQGQNENIEWVWEFIEVTNIDPSGGQIDNLKHLRGACVRLLIPQPNNGTLHLLKSFSLFILDPENVKLMEEASVSFSKGFIALMHFHNLTFDQILVHVEKFKTYVFDFSTHPGIQEIMDNQINMLSIKIHSEWLEKFNTNFLENYEQGYSHAS